ncbi:hypothetical protein J0H58_03885 [bacterium]|nr:hypothetical protein [bacterium]
MTSRYLILAGLLVVSGAAGAQPQPPSLPRVPIVPGPPPGEPPVEELVRQLEALQLQKATLLGEEEKLKSSIAKRLSDLQERMKKVEGVKANASAKAGGAKKDEQKVAQPVGPQPGQILQSSELEVVRERLEKLESKGGR